MRRLNAREEFCLWAGKEGWSTDTTETVLACSAKLHRLATDEANGYPNDVAMNRAEKRLRDALTGAIFAPFSSDGWLTTRLCAVPLPHSHDPCTGRAVPR